MPVNDFDDNFDRYERDGVSMLHEGSTPYELAEQGELLHQRLQLAVEERKKYEAMRAAYQAKSAYEELRLERLRLKETLLKLKQQLVRLQESRDRMCDQRNTSRKETLAALHEFIDFFITVQETFASEYDKQTLQEVMASVASDNPELCCPACQHLPTRILLGQRFCSACGWKPGDKDDTPF